MAGSSLHPGKLQPKAVRRPNWKSNLHAVLSDNDFFAGACRRFLDSNFAAEDGKLCEANRLERNISDPKNNFSSISRDLLFHFLVSEESYIFCPLVSGVKSKLRVEFLEDDTRRVETQLLQRLREKKPRHASGESEGYETMTQDSSDVTSEVIPITDCLATLFVSLAQLSKNILKCHFYSGYCFILLFFCCFF